ncbi:ubiquitin carboxyl-terminal hydrolase [Rhodotorula paludigena]|uniref:ubiquitin carboxyl-terminal hydrolase n=1 Tax=Rhodotorula paludigena TaxID=86838 RepID=UPI003180E270
MFWRTIPRATDVLARPDSGDPPDAAPPLRPPRPSTSADIHEAPTRAVRDGVVEEHSLTKPIRSPSRPPSRSSGALRRAVEAVIAEERRSTPRHMRDVVHAAVEQDRGERGATGFSGLLKKRKSVVSLFKRHAGAADAEDGPLEGSVQPSRRCSTPDSVSSTSDDDRPQQLASAQPAGVVRGLAQLPSAPSHAVARHSSSSDPFSPVLEPRKASSFRRQQAMRHSTISDDCGGNDDGSSVATGSLLSRDSLSDPDEESSEVAERSLSVNRPVKLVELNDRVSDLSRAARRSSLDAAPARLPLEPHSPFKSHAERTPPLPPSAFTGIVNLGNTCYLACVLQALFATKPLADFFLSGDYINELNPHSRSGVAGQLAKSLAQFVQVLKSGDYRSASPARLRDTLGRIAPQYRDRQQQDAQELLLALLDGLHDDLNLVVDAAPSAPLSPRAEAAQERLPEVIAADLDWARYRERNDSVIVDFFQGQLRNRMECLQCQQTSTTFSPLQTLSLSLPAPTARQKTVSLAHCIQEFLQEEIMHGDNAWNCPRCRCPCPASKRLSVARLPQFLIIHLKRFAYTSFPPTKVSTRVTFPLNDLELGHLLPPMALASPSPYSLNLPHEPRTRYELYAACCHLGEDGSGHYTAIVRRPDAPNAFVLIDDEQVDPLSSPAAQAAALRGAEETAYLLFYRIQPE